MSINSLKAGEPFFKILHNNGIKDVFVHGISAVYLAFHPKFDKSFGKDILKQQQFLSQIARISLVLGVALLTVSILGLSLMVIFKFYQGVFQNTLSSLLAKNWIPLAVGATIATLISGLALNLLWKSHLVRNITLQAESSASNQASGAQMDVQLIIEEPAGSSQTGNIPNSNQEIGRQNDVKFSKNTGNSIEAVCKWVSNKITQLNIISSNYLIRNFQNLEESFYKKNCEAIQDRINNQRFNINRNYNLNDFSQAEKYAHEVRKTNIGRCYELARVAFFYFMDVLNPEVKIDIYEIETGDHVFVVIGRKWDSDPHNYRNWGNDVWIFDAWTMKLFRVSDLEKNLECCERYATFDYKKVRTRPFNPDHDKICIQVSNFFAYRELREKTAGLSDMDCYLKALEQFEKADTVQQKIVTAHEILKLPQHQDRKIKTLVAQMTYFIEQTQGYKFDPTLC